MGLDWNPMAKPKPRHEAEFVKVFHALEKKRDDETLLARFREISQPPFELLDAPRVGIDKKADAWLKKQLKDKSKFEEARKSMHGYCVLDLLPECDGFPVYSNYGAYEGLDRFSFRGSFLDDAKDVLGEVVMARAYEHMLAADLLTYAAELHEIAEEFARENNVEKVEKVREVKFVEGSPRTIAHIIFAAAKWARFWSSRGHGLEPWF